MSNEIHIPYYKIDNTIYVTVRDSVGKVWHVSNGEFETWNDDNLAGYVINSTYSDGFIYTAIFPTAIANDYYIIMIFIQSGDTPNVNNDIWIGSMAPYWDADNEDLLCVKGDSLIEYSDGHRFTEKALEQSGGVSGEGVVTIERAPKVQVKPEEVVDAEDIPADVEVLPPGVQRTSSAKAGLLERDSSSRVGP
jgi:hypothetical protein